MVWRAIGLSRIRHLCRMQFITPSELMQARNLNHMTHEAWWRLVASGWQLHAIAGEGKVVLSRDSGINGVLRCEVDCEAGLFRQLAAEMQNRERAEEIATVLAKEMKVKLEVNPNLWRFRY